jgi:hypothetical protein
VLVAVIVAVPFVTAVKRPADETVAIVVSEDAHVTVTSGMVSPASSLTVEVMLVVSPNDTNASDVSDNVTAAVDTLIESGLVAIWPSPLVTLAVNSLVPLAVGVPEIVDPTSESPAGSVPALIDHEDVPPGPAALNSWLYSFPIHAVGREGVDTVNASVQFKTIASPIEYSTGNSTAQRAICCASTMLV